MELPTLLDEEEDETSLKEWAAKVARKVMAKRNREESMPVTINNTTYYTDDMKKMLAANRRHTPDITYLNQFENHYVFLYDEHRRGASRYEKLATKAGCKWIGAASTAYDGYDMVIDGEEARVAVIPDVATPATQGKVKGELWLVPSSTIMHLDEYYQNGIVYERAWATVFYGPHKLSSFIYIGNKDAYWKWISLIDYPSSIINGRRYFDFKESIKKDAVQKFINNPTGAIH